MRIIACITQVSVIDQILTHLRTRATHAPTPAREVPPRPADHRTVCAFTMIGTDSRDRSR